MLRLTLVSYLLAPIYFGVSASLAEKHFHTLQTLLQHSGSVAI